MRNHFFPSFVLIVAGCIGVNAQSEPRWVPAHFHGLTMGTSSGADVIRVLGKPEVLSPEEDTGVPMLTYEVNDPLPAYLYVYIRKGVLRTVRLGLKTPISRDEVMRRFGHDFIVKRYEADDCKAIGGTAPIYESKDGSIESMEYRGLGIAINLNQDKATEISYINKSDIPRHSRCKGQK